MVILQRRDTGTLFPEKQKSLKTSVNRDYPSNNQKVQFLA